jgi:hypothetical protein
VTGIGGRIKGLARPASLIQRPIDNPILTPSDIFSWASESIDGITFLNVNQSEVNQRCKLRKNTFEI